MCHPTFRVAYPAAYRPVFNVCHPNTRTRVRMQCPVCGTWTMVEEVEGHDVTLEEHEGREEP